MIALALCLTLPGSLPQGFSLGRNVVSPPSGSFAEAVDFDGDGDDDVMTSTGPPNYRLLWYENSGPDAGFEQEWPIGELTGSANSAVAADLDGDGDPDALVATDRTDDASSSLGWFENLDGQGSFGPERMVLGAGGEFLSVHAADLDGDGDLDAVAGGLGIHAVAWFENLDGLGAFGSTQPIADVAGGMSSVTTGDVDADGDLDVLASARTADTIFWYENLDGSGAFGAGKIVSALPNRPESILAADLDSDGDLDVASASYLDDTIAWYANADGLGGFGPRIVVDDQKDQAESVHAADLDADGDLDLLGTNRGNKFPPALFFGKLLSWVTRYENEGGGGFGPPVLISHTTRGAGWVRTGHFGGTEALDVLVAARGGYHQETYSDSYARSRVVWFPDVSASPSLVDSEPIAPLLNEPILVPGDLDGDGLDDLAATWDDGTRLGWLQNTGDGAFSAPKTVGAFPFGTGDLELADYDGDGSLDLLFLSTGIRWAKNLDGAGGFADQVEIIEDSPKAYRPLDVDADGDADIVLGTFSELLWRRTTDEASGPEQVIDTEADNAKWIDGADFDGDGTLDVMVATNQFGSEPLIWYRNLSGAGFFGLPNHVSMDPPGVSEIRIGDLDNDGDIDFIRSLFADVYLHENLDGAGVFGPSIPLFSGVPTTLRDLHLTDLNGDGDLDLLGTLIDPSMSLNWHENLGGLSFGAPQLLLEDQNVDLQPGDFNGDGRVDVLVHGDGNNTQDFGAWLANEVCAGSAPALEVIRVGSPPNPQALLVGQTSAPVIGAVWDPMVDHATFEPGAVLDILGVSSGAINVPTAAGTLLCATASTLALVTATPGAPFELRVPESCELVGLEVCAQAASFTAGGSLTLTNAIDLTIGSF